MIGGPREGPILLGGRDRVDDGPGLRPQGQPSAGDGLGEALADPVEGDAHERRLARRVEDRGPSLHVLHARRELHGRPHAPLARAHRRPESLRPGEAEGAEGGQSTQPRLAGRRVALLGYNITYFYYYYYYYCYCYYYY